MTGLLLLLLAIACRAGTLGADSTDSGRSSRVPPLPARCTWPFRRPCVVREAKPGSHG
jgi:hypothetical protein